MVIGEDLGHSPLLQSVAMRTGKEGEREREEDLPFCVLLYNLPSVFTLSFNLQKLSTRMKWNLREAKQFVQGHKAY